MRVRGCSVPTTPYRKRALGVIMVINIDIKDEYLDSFYNYVDSMPKGAIVIPTSLDDEIIKRVNQYKKDKSKSVSFSSGLDESLYS